MPGMFGVKGNSLEEWYCALVILVVILFTHLFFFKIKSYIRSAVK
jgi:hypothetical protein